MSNGSNKSVDRTPVTGEPVDVHKERQKQEAEDKIRRKVQETAESLGKVIRKSYGPPGTP